MLFVNKNAWNDARACKALSIDFYKNVTPLDHLLQASSIGHPRYMTQGEALHVVMKLFLSEHDTWKKKIGTKIAWVHNFYIISGRSTI